MNTKELEYNRKRVALQAKRYAESQNCNCGKKKWKVVELYEYGDPYLPSTVLIVCQECFTQKVFASAPIDSAKAYAIEMKEKGFVEAPDGMVDKLIQS